MTTTATTTSRPQRQSLTSFDDDGHYSDIHLSVSGSGGPARIQTWRRSFIDEYDHYDQVATDSGTVEERQTSPDHYQGLDQAVLAALRQPPAPHQYASIIPNAPGIAEEIHNAELGGRPINPENHEYLESASFNELSPPPHEYANVSGTSRITGSGAHDYLELIADSHDDYEN